MRFAGIFRYDPEETRKLYILGELPTFLIPYEFQNRHPTDRYSKYLLDMIQLKNDATIPEELKEKELSKIYNNDPELAAQNFNRIPPFAIPRYYQRKSVLKYSRLITENAYLKRKYISMVKKDELQQELMNKVMFQK